MKIFFKTMSLALVFVHLFTVCLRDAAFAKKISKNSQNKFNYEMLGKIPDIRGHAKVQRPDNLYASAGELPSSTVTSFYQKDSHTPSDKFNRILESVTPDPFTGKAQATIPIFTPKGKRDITLPLNITYNNNSGNGIVGVGWSLDLGSIVRSTKRGVPKYNSADIFAANGEELVCINNNEYRAKIESSFLKYTYSNDSWQVMDKSGVKFFFGSTDGARINISKGTFSWALDKILDKKGNSLSISYIKEFNCLYPSEISYTFNEQANLPAKYKIVFSYESRIDQTLSYIISDQVKTSRRLKSIEVLYDNKLVRRYIFEYITSPSTQRSLLSKVTEYGSDGISASNPVTFSYCSNKGSWSQDQPKWHVPDGDFMKGGQDQGRRVYDLNGDGMFDFVISRYDPTESTTRQWLRATHLNSKDGFSASANWWPVPLGYFIYQNWDDGRRLVDLTGDGIPELLAASLWDPYTGVSGQYKNAYVFQYPDPQNPRWVQDTRWNLPEGYFIYGTKIDGGRRFADLNGDGLNDLSIAIERLQWSSRPLDYIPATINTYINTGSGWQQDTRWNPPDGYYVRFFGYTNQAFVGRVDVPVDGGRRLADINGDGLADYLVASDGYKATYLNNGSGWTRNDAFNVPDGDFVADGRDQGRMIVDINGDGLNDLVIARAGYHVTYINTGSGWSRDDSFNLPDGDFVDSLGQDQGRYLADLDGDGVVDICIAKDGYKKAYLNLAGPADLLTDISNGIGGATEIEYAPSTTFNNYYPNTTGRLPFAVQVVSKITLNDGMGNSYSTKYSYKDGCFDAGERDFRGFGYVKIIDVDGNYTESYFKQDAILKGRMYRQETRDATGKLYAKTENTWVSSLIYTGVNFVYQAQVDSFIYDPDNNVNYKQTRVTYAYDSYGNPVKVYSYGDVSVTGDEQESVTEYVYNIPDWILSAPKYSYVKDKSGNIVSKKWFYYDNAVSVDTAPLKGSLTKEEAWLYNPLASTERTISSNYAYDDCGNLVRATDALGRSVATEYDTLMKSYPVKSINALGQVVTTSYDFSTGQALSTTDPNRLTTTNYYDALGRLIKAVGPEDSLDYPAATYEYNLSVFPIKTVQRVKTEYSGSPKYYTAYSFYDGLGRLIEAKSMAENENQQIISGIVTYSAKGQVKEKYLPYYVSASENYVSPIYQTAHSSYSFDAMGRLVQATNPDLTFSKVSYGLTSKTATDENGHYKTEYFDAYGRIIRIEEHNSAQTYTTVYEYDTAGNLVKLTDNQGNISQIWYDSLGRKIKMNDPDMGVWFYEYDDAGNLIRQTDAKGQALSFTYDSLNRLIAKQGLSPDGGAVPATLATYYYDDAAKDYCIGRLSKIVDQSGSTDFYYDRFGKEVKSVKTVNGYGAYTLERTYDALGRLLTLKYPDGETVSYTHNPQGIASVSNYISDIDYLATGQITKIKYSNGVETNYAYDPNTLRLSHISSVSASGRIQDLSYQFDNVGNIKNICDYVNTASQSFNYDDLDRLVTASGSYGTFAYSYDSIGNMTGKEGVSLVYGKNGLLPHAVTKYGSTSIDYDANGNMVKKGTVQLTYDTENRLVKSEDASVVFGGQSAAVSLSLSPGWNFISFPVTFSNNSIVSVLSGISGKYSQVSRYNPLTRKYEHYVGNSKFDQFSTFEFGKGYQIYITSSAAVNLTVSGIFPVSQNVLLSPGYNLIFSPKKEETAVEEALSGLKLGVNYSKVMYYNRASGVYQEYSAAKKEFTTLKPGAAYFVYCLSGATWAVSNASASGNTTFVYDGDGGRVKKVTSSGTAVYIGSLFEIDSSGKATKHIFCGSNRVCAVESTGGKFYYHSDHLGSSNVVTDAGGRQVGFTEFTPYGGVYRQAGSYDPKYKFTGKELDSCGLYFYGARYYDAQLGRFATADTIVQAPYDPQSLNRYSYCRNNPVNYVDPTGHSWWKKFWGAIVGAVAGVVGTILSGGNMMVGFQIFNFFNSLGSAVKTGNWGGFAGGVAGGLIGGWAGGALAGKVSGFLGKNAFSFGGGFLVGATEMGIGGFGGSFGSALGGGASFSDAMKQGAIGFGIGAAIGGLVEGSYLSGMQNFAHGMSREQAYMAGVRRLHALSVNASDKTTAIVGARPLEAPDKAGSFRHRYIRGRVGRFEMGPDEKTGLIELNAEGSLARTEDYINYFPNLTLESTVSVSQSGFNSSVDLYKSAWVGTKYRWYNCNSNFAVNTVIYGAGANAPEDLGLTPIGIDHYSK